MDTSTLLHITPDGEIVHQPHGRPQGLLIVDSEHHKPLLTISEVSDDETVNLFIDKHQHSRLIQWSTTTDDIASEIELLANRVDLADPFAPHHPSKAY